MRTLKQIYDSIRAAFGASPVLAALDIDVPTSVEYNIIAASAQGHMALEAVWDTKQRELQVAAERTQNYSAPWYEFFAKQFQYGDSLIWDTTYKRYTYAVIDPAKQIVKYAAIAPNPNGGATLKVAKDSGGMPVKLTSAERLAHEGYWALLKPFNGPLGIISEDPDEVRIELTVHFAGIRPLPLLQADVEAAVNRYLSTLEFGGIFRISRLVDEIQKVQGVVDVVVTLVSAHAAGSSAVSVIASEYRTFAGFAIVDPVYPLSTSLTYQVATQ